MRVFLDTNVLVYLFDDGEPVKQRAARLLSQAHSLAWFDALIVQAALEAGCTHLYSEDLQHGRRFGALQVVNPFV